MIHRIVQFALRQRFLVLMLTAILVLWGVLSFHRMPVDAYPDLSPPMVEIITQWPGHAAEEVERLVTLPIEVEMNGMPHLVFMRSISLYGLSDVILTFQDDTDDYFARQVVFERLSGANVPDRRGAGARAPVQSQRACLSLRHRKPRPLAAGIEDHEDWVLERAYKSVPGVADDSGFGGTVMQYQVLLDPARLYGFHLTVPQVIQALSANNANTGGGFYSQGGQFYYVRGLGLARDTKDIGNIVVASNNGAPVRVRDIGDVVIGHAPRLGEFGFQKNDDAVEGVILMRRGEQTQNVLKGVEEKTKELNRTGAAQGRQDPSLLRPQRPGAVDHRYGGRKPAARHDPGVDRADFFPGERARRHHHRAHHPAGAAVRLHHSPCPQHFRQPALHRRHRLRHHHRRHRGDDGEHLPRAGAAAQARSTTCTKSSWPRRGTWTGPSFIRWRSSSPATCPFMCCTALPACSSIPWPIPCRSR